MSPCLPGAARIEPSTSMITAQSFEHRYRLIEPCHFPLRVIPLLPQIPQYSTEISHTVPSLLSRFTCAHTYTFIFDVASQFVHHNFLLFLQPHRGFLPSPEANFVRLEFLPTLPYTARQIVENLSRAISDLINPMRLSDSYLHQRASTARPPRMEAESGWAQHIGWASTHPPAS